MKILIFIEKALLYLFWICTSLAFDEPRIAILTMLSAVIHELGHLSATLKLKNGSPLKLKAKISGPKLGIGRLSYGEELFVTLSGPLANLAACIPSLILFLLIKHRFLCEFTVINILTALSNLSPIVGFDGYKILYCLVARSNLSPRFFDLLYWCSFLLTSILVFLSLYFLLKLGEGYWTFALFFSILITEISKRQNRAI